MRRTMFAAAAVALLAAGALLPSRAEAMTIAAPIGLKAAIGDRLAEDAAYVCRPVRRCGYWGCSWRRVCWWTRPYGHYWGPPYRYRYGYWRHW